MAKCILFSKVQTYLVLLFVSHVCLSMLHIYVAQKVERSMEHLQLQFSLILLFCKVMILAMIISSKLAEINIVVAPIILCYIKVQCVDGRVRSTQTLVRTL